MLAKIQFLMDRYPKASPLSSLLFITLPSGALLIALGLWFEPTCSPLTHMSSHTFLHVLNNLAAVGNSISGYQAQRATSALTFKVNSFGRNMGIVIGASLLYGEVLTWLQVCGYVVAGLGFLWYFDLKAKRAVEKIKES